RTATQLGYCLDHHPAPGEILDETHSFTIIKELRTGDRCNAQIVLTDNGKVAKIYDPLYYRFDYYDPVWERYRSELKADAVYEAEIDYYNEFLAYEEFAGDPVQGTAMPRYFKSWTINVPVTLDGRVLFRQVRMILLEYILGKCMLDIEPSNLSLQARRNVMVKLIEAYCDIKFKGVVQHDIAPRNIIICGENYEDLSLRVCIIDFNRSTVFHVAFEVPRSKAWAIFRYRNPLLHFSGLDDNPTFDGWLSEDEHQTKAWMWHLWEDGVAGKYAKVKENPKRRWSAVVLDDNDVDWEGQHPTTGDTLAAETAQIGVQGMHRRRMRDANQEEEDQISTQDNQSSVMEYDHPASQGERLVDDKNAKHDSFHGFNNSSDNSTDKNTNSEAFSST
ncbi:hypothetical protein BS50DRAFT_485251, partial [Corynespora cassiicola Philippines]